MQLKVQFALKKNLHCLAYLHEHAIWYKILNRNPEKFRELNEIAREYYKLRPSDKIEKMVDTMSFVSNLMANLK